MSQVDGARISETFYSVIVPGIGHEALVAIVSRVQAIDLPQFSLVLSLTG